MTVSPSRPQDDAMKPADAGRPAAAEASDMPPTLFRLPNLNPASEVPDPIQDPNLSAQSPGQEPAGATPAVPINPVAIPVDISPEAADAAAQATQKSGQTFQERPAPINDAPAGRSWMEVTRQHGVVVVLLLIVVRVQGSTSRWWAVCALLALIVLAQGAWLIPELAARTDLIIAGGEPPASHAHSIYAVLEIAKIALLLLLGFSALAEAR